MKKLIILTAMFACVGFSGICQEKNISFPEAEKQIPIVSFDQLIVNGNFNVVLVENDQPAIYLKGDERFIKSFRFSLKNKSLIISSNYTRNSAIKNQVCINVKKLQTLIVQQESVINIVGINLSDNSKVQLNAECEINVGFDDIAKIRANGNFTLEIL